MNRRSFLRYSAATGAIALVPGASVLAASQRRVRSVNSEIRAAVIGIKGRGTAHINGLHRIDGVKVVAICDVDRHVLAREAKKFEDRGEAVDSVVDLRHLMDRDDIDVIATATPNHWHALITIWACQTGKDVYVEKPVSHNVWEGRQMVNAARAHNRIVQTGTQSRSSQGMREAIEWLHASGELGAIKRARGTCYKPRPSIGNVDGSQPIPDHIDYDLWTGPAPLKPLTRKNLHYDWHWVFDTGNGDLGNQGIHQMDMCRWALGYDTLSPRVMAVGGRVGYKDNGNTPNTMFVYHDYDGAPIIFEVRGLPRDKASQSNWNKSMDRHHGMSVGAAVECEGGILSMPNYSEAHAYDNDGKTIKSWKGASDHFVNFIKAVRSRKQSDLNADIEEGHLSSALCHTGNISYMLGRASSPDEIQSALSSNADARETFGRMAAHLDANEVDIRTTQLTVGSMLEMDPSTERFTEREDANELLTRRYRAPFVVPRDV